MAFQMSSPAQPFLNFKMRGAEERKKSSFVHRTSASKPNNNIFMSISKIRSKIWRCRYDGRFFFSLSSLASPINIYGAAASIIHCKMQESELKLKKYSDSRQRTRTIHTHTRLEYMGCLSNSMCACIASFSLSHCYTAAVCF